MRGRRRLLAVILGMASAMLLAGEPALQDCRGQPSVCVASLEQLTLPAMRGAKYGSALNIVAPYPAHSPHHAFIIGFDSNQLALYSRIDLPATAASAAGYPIVVLAPGWVSREEALDWNFGGTDDSLQSQVVSSLVEQDFAVITVGYRGRGTINGVRSEGMAFRDAWGNGSYLSPMFYAMDVLNLIAGLHGLEDLDWADWLPGPRPHFDLERVSLWGHSQGGDVAITALAVIGDNPRFPQKLHSASIWSGNIPDRFTQADTFGAMASTLQAFMSGDGTWTGTAIGRDGAVNPDFIYPWPSDWIGTVDTQSPQWTGQADTWSVPTVAEARRVKYDEMYTALNRYAADIEAAEFEISKDELGATVILHDARVAHVMPRIGGYHYAKWIRTPLALHISDRDYYSMPAWNNDLAARINGGGGSARVYLYPGTTHSLGVSKHPWFSPPGTESGVPVALRRDLELYSTGRLPD